MAAKNILILSYVHEGGEWIATQRLINEVKKLTKDYHFYLVGYTEEIRTNLNCFDKIVYVKKTKANPPFRFFKTMFIDICNVRYSIQKFYEEIGSIDYILATHYLMVFPVFLVNKVREKKIIFLFHGTKSIPIKKLSDIDYRNIVIKILERLSLLLTSYIVVPSLFAKKFVRNLINPFAHKKKFYVTPNSVPYEFLKNIPKKALLKFRNKNNIPKKAKIILYSGRITKYKGIENLVDAFIRFVKFYKNSYLIIAYPKSSSDMQIFNYLRKKIKENNISAKVKFFSDIKSSEMVNIYRISNVLVLASELEMASLSIIESLACGTPCIATKVGNAEELLSKVDSNLLLRESSPKEILSKLKYFFSIEKTKLEIIRGRSRNITKNFTDIKSAKIFIQSLESIIA